jgi:hypothetical protein
MNPKPTKIIRDAQPIFCAINFRLLSWVPTRKDLQIGMEWTLEKDKLIIVEKRKASNQKFHGNAR